MSVDVDELIERVRRCAAVDAEIATLDDLDAAAPDLNAIIGWAMSRRSAWAGRRTAIADEAAAANAPPPDRGDPDGAHQRNSKQSRRASARDRERDTTMILFPRLRGLLEVGTIDAEHVDIVTAALGDLTEQQRFSLRDHDAEIAVLAAANTPDGFRKALSALVIRLLHEDGIRRFERQRRNTKLRAWTDRDTGMVKLFGEFDPERGAIILHALQVALDALYAQPVPTGCPDDPIAKNDHLRAIALLQVLQSMGTGIAPGGPDQADLDMVIIVDEHTLRDGVHDHSIIDAGPGIDLPVETLRRLACCANIIPAVLGSDGVILDLGRTARLANRQQRRALRAMYPTCAITGCVTRFEHCKIHHILWWDRDHGLTDMVNLLPLCERHHHAVHEGGWLLTMDPTTRALTIRFPDGATTVMPPHRAGWNAGAGDTAAVEPTGRPSSVHDPSPSRRHDASTSDTASTSVAQPDTAQRNPRGRPHPEPEPEPPPNLTLWAS